MKHIILKLLSDFRKSKLKLVLLILAAGLSSWGISSVMYGYFLTERDFEVNFLSTSPADLTLTISNFNGELLELLLEDENVVGLERRELINGRIKSSEDSWMPLVLYGVDRVGQMKYDQFKINDPENSTAGKVLIEQNASYYLSDKQHIEVLLGASEEVITFSINGLAHDPRQAPARMEGIVYAYVTSLDLIAPYLESGKYRLLVETNVSDDITALEQVVERLKAIAAEKGATVVSYYIPPPGEHVHQGIVDGIAFMQESSGLILSLMGVILLSLILLTWLYPQFSDVGVMKAIGVSTVTLFYSYVIMLLIIIAIGLAIGLPLGYLTAFWYNKAVAFFQNFEVVNEGLPFAQHLVVIGVATIVPGLFAIYPLMKSTSISVNEALNKTFYFSGNKILRWTQQLFGGVYSKYILHNLFRQFQRTGLLIVLLGIGIGLYFTANNVAYSIRLDLERYSQTSEYEVVVGLPKEVQWKDVRYLEDLQSVESIVPIRTDKVSYQLPYFDHPEQVNIRQLPGSIKIDPKYLVRGELRKDCAKCLYVQGEIMTNIFSDVNPGDSIFITNYRGEQKAYLFAGAISDLVILGTPFLVFDDSVVDQFNTVAFELDPNLTYDQVTEVSNNIDDTFLDHGINLIYRSSIKRRMAGILGHMEPTFLIIKVTGILTIILGMLGLLIVLKLTLEERTREIGILKSIGSTSAKISVFLNIEFLMVSLMAVFAGTLIAIPLANGLISVVAEAILKHTVIRYDDFQTTIISVLILVILQFSLITVYNRMKIGKKTRSLLDFHF